MACKTKLGSKNIFFFDIETAPTYSYSELPEAMKDLWVSKYCRNIENTPEAQEELYYKQAGLYAEYSRIICASVGYDDDDGIKIKSVYDEDEKVLIKRFFDLIDCDRVVLGGFNIKSFDMPFVCKRSIINGLKAIPKTVNHLGKKPWDIDSVDVMNMWKFGGTIGCGLDLLCNTLGVKSPKGTIKWNMIANYYHSKDYNIEEVVKYCEKDVTATIEVFKLLNEIK